MRSFCIPWRKSMVPVATFLGVASAAASAHADRSSTTIDQGYELGEIQEPRSVAMAGADEAWGGSTGALFKNPANLLASRVYHLEGLAAFGPEARRQSFGGAVVDSSKGRLAGGIGGTWNEMDPDGIKRSWTDLRLALAYLFGNAFSLGMTGRYLRVMQRTAAGPLGASLASDGTSTKPIFNQLTFDAGAALTLAEGVRLGVSGHNLTSTKTSLAPVLLGTGLGFSNGMVTLEGDVQFDFTTYSTTRARAMLGAEYIAAGCLPLRAGYRYDDGTKTHGVGFGVGYTDPRFGIEVSARRDLVADHPATMISIALRIFIDVAMKSDSASQD
ncbi:MAG: hypothetical protein FWD73_06690 [Polyangiaceae bacterium]|nr:hypothetical protein [Polyangiaceae bacterium]